MGILTREFDVRIIDVSASGCLIETARRMEIGTVGALRLRVGNAEYLDVVQVVRHQPLAGAGSTCRVGVKFLSTTPRGAGSIRHAVATEARAGSADPAG
jgi:PilZ domain